ncbi:MAG: hypothetical protein R6V58_07805 [Planctomycetota bacterium]
MIIPKLCGSSPPSQVSRDSSMVVHWTVACFVPGRLRLSSAPQAMETWSKMTRSQFQILTASPPARPAYRTRRWRTMMSVWPRNQSWPSTVMPGPGAVCPAMVTCPSPSG